MRLLLDTHIWIWLVDQPERLGERTKGLLLDDRNDTCLSSLSIWEFVTLAQKGRFPLLRDPTDWVEGALRGWPLRDVPATREVMLELTRFELPHKDPVDRVIVATARVLGCSLVTADAKIIDSAPVAIVPND